ncbi:dihydrolipoamide dehydrogenase, partial [mine drainage metagenome]
KEESNYGTTCARVGCMPSKLLIAVAEAAHAIGKASGFGIQVEGVIRIDGRMVMDRIQRERDRFIGFVLRETQTIPEENRIHGHARFLNNHTIAVDDH